MTRLSDKVRELATLAGHSPESRHYAKELTSVAAMIDAREAMIADIETVRDRIAMVALQGLLAATDPETAYDRTGMAGEAYSYADAMLQVRKQ